jgi:hypothetical protein
MNENRFDTWITELREDVIEGEFGYESGEFSVTPALWRPLYDEGLTPLQAFQRALDAHKAERDEEDAERKRNWERIQAKDAAIRASRPA